ncbi:MAG: hypothetical protein AAF533_27620 [Acidobacteriota bacterium]
MIGFGPLTLDATGDAASCRRLEELALPWDEHRAGLALRLDVDLGGRGLPVRPGQRLRVDVSRDDDGRHALSHDFACSLDQGGERATLSLAELDGQRRDDAIQNGLRVLCAWRLAETDTGLLLHAAAVTRAGVAELLLGASGVGKSTLARLAAPRPVLADDVVLVLRRDDGGWSTAASPFFAEPSFPGRSRDGSALRCGRLLLLEQAARPCLSDVPVPLRAAAVAAHAPFLTGVGLEEAGLRLAKDLVTSIPSCRFAFAPDASAWSLLDPAGTKNGSEEGSSDTLPTAAD